MGEIILCHGSRTNRPYVVESAKMRIYSIEELCYYIYHHIFYIDVEFFSDNLINWIDDDLCLPERAKKLRQMINENADFTSLVIAILCSCDYYNKADITIILRLLNEISRMAPIEKRCYRANSYLGDGNYMAAAREYELIIREDEVNSLPPGDYGDILHNLGIANAYVYGVGNAVNYFREAHKLNLKPESLWHYLYALLITDHKEQYLTEIEAYQIDGLSSEEMIKRIKELEKEAKKLVMSEKINELKKLLDEGKTDEYNKKTKKIIEFWKNEYRSSI